MEEWCLRRKKQRKTNTPAASRGEKALHKSKQK
jgi:hypothetical protein